MQVPSRPVLTRAAIVAAALTALLSLQPEPARGTGGTARVLVLSDQARRYLALQYRAYPTEFLGCMIGELRGRSVVVWRIAPADVDPAHSTPTHVMAEQACEAAGWSPTIGMIHSHPDGERCWYYFPGTEVASSDGQAFARQPYAVDAIMCGEHIVWIGRDKAERQLRLVAADQRAASAISIGDVPRTSMEHVMKALEGRP